MHSFHREQKSAIGKTDLSSRSVNLRVLIIGRESKAPGSCGTSPQGPLTIQDLCTPRRTGSLSNDCARAQSCVTAPVWWGVLPALSSASDTVISSSFLELVLHSTSRNTSLPHSPPPQPSLFLWLLCDASPSFLSLTLGVFQYSVRRSLSTMYTHHFGELIQFDGFKWSVRWRVPDFLSRLGFSDLYYKANYSPCPLI